jgi:predicted GNAT family acetyltransferase
MTTPAALAWQLFDDPAAFLAVAGDTLAADPVLSTVVATNAQRWADRYAAGEDRPDHPCWFAAATDLDGVVVGAAMRTAPFAPYPLYVLAMSDAAARALADALLARGEQVDAANGSLPAVDVFARHLAERTGRVARTSRPTRFYELGSLVEQDRLPAGRARLAERADLDLLLAWTSEFLPEADRQAGRTARPASDARPQDVLERIDGHRMWLWEADGEAVAMTGFQGPAFGTARIGPVFTPADQRGRGYASALVAHASRELTRRGLRVCLATDLDNPVSNAVYVRLGYEPAGDTAEMRLDGV